MDAPLYESSEIPSIIELNFHGDFPFLTYQMNVEVLSSTKVLLTEFTDKLPLAFVCLGVRVQGGRVLELLPANVTGKEAAVALFEMHEANVSQEVAGTAETFIAMVARVRIHGVVIVRPRSIVGGGVNFVLVAKKCISKPIKEIIHIYKYITCTLT